MKSYTLPVLMKGDQLTHVKLLPLRDIANGPLDTTLIALENSSTKLISFLSDVLIGDAGRDDKQFVIHSISKIGRELHIKLGIGPYTGVLPVCSCKVSIAGNSEDGVKDLLYEDSKEDLSGIRFFVEIDHVEYQGFRPVKYVSLADLFDVAIDFGSESSQMTIWSNNSAHLVRTPIVDSLRTHFYHSATDDVHQEETAELYKTLFFLKKKEASFDLVAEPGSDSSELLPLITRVMEADSLQSSSRLISNLKLAHLGAYNFEVYFKSHYKDVKALTLSSMMEDVHQKVINSLLHVALKEIRKQLPPDSGFHIRLKLLVPNVISQKNVSGLIERTNDFLNKACGFSSLQTFQTLTLSESDASFLGYWSENKPDGGSNNRSADTRFIIIDMGKGTTDFSVISSDAAYQITSEYRSGFVGAGNVITYAFMETLITLIFGKNEKKKRKAIKKLLINGAAVAQMELLGLVEKMKANYGVEGCKPVKSLSFSPEIQGMLKSGDILTTDDKQLRTFVKEILEKQPSIPDEFGYIEEAEAELCNKIIESLSLFIADGYRIEKKSKIKVILTGRSFLFKPLYDRIKKVFHNLFDSGIEIILLDDLDDKTRLKKICLEGTFSNATLNYSSGLIGIPLVVNHSSVSQVRMVNSAGSETKPFNGRSFDLFGILSSSDSAEKERPIPHYAEAKTVENAPHKEDNVRKMALGNYSMGQKFNRNSDTIFISGVHYRFDHTIGDDFKLYYDGEHIYARTLSDRVKLEVPPAFAKNPKYLFETLFPYNNLIGEEEIVVRTDIDAIQEM